MALKRNYLPPDDTPDILGKYRFDSGDDIPNAAFRSGNRKTWKSYVGDVGGDDESLPGYGGDTGGDTSPTTTPAGPPQGKCATPDEERATHDTLTGSQGDSAGKCGAGAMAGMEGSDWADSAPEASGAGGVETTPRDAAPRGNTPITKYDVPPAGTRKRLADAEAEYDKTLKEVTGWRGVGSELLGLGGFNRMRLGSHAANVRQLRGEVAYEDNRRGAEILPGSKYDVVENGKTMRYATTRGGQRVLMGEAPENAQVTAARTRQEIASKRAANLKQGMVDSEGNLHYVDPETGEEKVSSKKVRKEAAGPAAPGGEAPYSEEDVPVKYPVPGADRGERPLEATNDAGTLSLIDPRTGKVISRVPGAGKTKEHPEKPEKEDPIETSARSASTRAIEDAIEKNDTPEQAARMGQEVYTRTRAALSAGKSGQLPIDPEKPPAGTIRTSKKTGKKEVFTSTGWQPFTGTR